MLMPLGIAQEPSWKQDLPPSIHILPDGSVEPSTAAVSRNGDLYTLTGNVGTTIIIDKDNVTIDGAGYSLLGNFSRGVWLNNRVGVTVKNLTIQNVENAFDLSRAADNTLIGNTIINCSKGFYLWISWRNNIIENTLTNAWRAFDIWGAETASSQHNLITNNTIQNSTAGIILSQPNNEFSNNLIVNCSELGIGLHADSNVLRNNTLIANKVNFEVSAFKNIVDESNTINGKPIIYWVGLNNRTVPQNAAYVVLTNCNNIHMRELNIEGIAVYETSNSLISENRIIGTYDRTKPTTQPTPSLFRSSTANYGIQLVKSTNITLSGNTVWNKIYGVKVVNSTSNTLIGNSINGNRYYGLYLTYSHNNTINDNTIAENGFITESFSLGEAFGVSISDSSYNQFIANNVTNNNHWGIRVLSNQHDNVFYHNNFIDNKPPDNNLQVSMLGLYPDKPANPSIWDNGIEGNYWSDYLTRYTNASEVDNTGIGNTPFVINENNIDHYPLMMPYTTTISPSPTPPTSPSTEPTSSPSAPTSQSPYTPTTTTTYTATPTTSPTISNNDLPWLAILIAIACILLLGIAILVWKYLQTGKFKQSHKQHYA
jgi:parallel beta-helix repeat protein